MQRLLIVTTDKRTLKWKSLPDKLAQIQTALNQTKNATWKVDIEYKEVIPLVSNGRIAHHWMNNLSYPYFRQGYKHLYLHFLMKRWRDLGLDAGIRGANHKDSDFVGESYGRGDEHTKRNDTGENQFVQNVLHEMSHELHRTTGMIDKTHEYHNKYADISGIFATIDMANWQPEYQRGMSLVARLKAQLNALIYAKK